MKHEFQGHSGRLTWRLALLLSALMAGCGGGGGPEPLLDTSGNVGLAPTVRHVTPVPNATGVPINTKIITAAFTKAMDPATLTTASFTLTCPTGTPQTGTVGYVTTGAVATLTLAVANNLPVSSLCTATITTGAKSTEGIPLDSNFVWTFTTGLAIDNTAPTVTGTINANGATGVALNTKVGATFSEAMDPLTINASTFTLKQGVNAVAGTVTYAGVNVVFAPASNLAPSTTYTATVTTGARDVRGNPLAANFVWIWTTGAALDTTAPTVTGTVHTNGQTNVAINTAVGATFSEGMDPLTITNANVMLTTDAGVAVPAIVSYSGVSVVFRPLANLANSTHYNGLIRGGVTGVKDLAGNPLAADFTIGWTTAAAPDTTAPTVTGTVHTNGQTNVAINTAVGATFSEGMDPLTITNANVMLTTDAGVAVPAIVSYSGVSVVFRPLANLANSTHYNGLIRGGVTGVKDLAGNPLAADFTIGWTTAAAPDTTAPTVTGTINANGATNVAINTAIGATFSEGMDPLTITNLSFAVTTDAGAVVPGTVSYSGVSAVFIPLNSLASSTHYNVTLKRGINGVKDLAGNPMVADFNISWTTAAAPDTTAPTVVRTIHTNGQTNVPVNTTVGATFSEGMDPLTVTNLNFTLKETLTGNLVAGTITYSGVNATVVPLNSLAYSTNYTVTVKSGINGVKDLAGNPMANDFSINWTTGVLPDAIAPTVTANYPLANSTIFILNPAIAATFSEAMDPLTISTATFKLTTAFPTITTIAGTVSYSTNGNIATFTPLADLPIQRNFTATVTTGVKDVAGNALVNEYSWNFNTQPFPVTTTTSATTTTTATATTTTLSPPVSFCQQAFTQTDHFTAATSINGQNGWASSGGFDEQVQNVGAIALAGQNVWRLSNKIASSAYSNQPLSPQLSESAGESTVRSAGGGDAMEAVFWMRPVSSSADGSAITLSMSPPAADRQTYLRIENNLDANGGNQVRVIDYYDVIHTNDYRTFVTALNISRNAWTKVRLVMETPDGSSNDIFQVFLNDQLVGTYSTWEDYHTWPLGGNSVTEAVTRLLFRVSVAPSAVDASFADANAQGFYFDNLCYRVYNRATPSSTLQFYRTGFEP